MAQLLRPLALISTQMSTEPNLNLPYNASSTGTNVINVTIPLSGSTSKWHSLLLCCVYHGSTNARHLSFKYVSSMCFV